MRAPRRPPRRCARPRSFPSTGHRPVRSFRPLALTGLLAAVVPSPHAAGAAPAKPTFQLEDLRRLVRIGDVALSPDGRQVAVVVSTPDWDSDESKQEIDLVDVATGARRPLTQHR